MTYSGKIVLFAIFFLLVSLAEAFVFGFMGSDDDFEDPYWMWPTSSKPKRGRKQRLPKKQGPPPASPVQPKQKGNKRAKKQKRAAPAKQALQVQRQDQQQEGVGSGPGSAPVLNLPNTPQGPKIDAPIARDAAPIERQQEVQENVNAPSICDYIDCNRNNGAKLKMGNGNSMSSTSSATVASFDEDEDEEGGNNNSNNRDDDDEDEQPNSWVSSSSSDFGQAYAESSSGKDKVKCNSGQKSGDDSCEKEMEY